MDETMDKESSRNKEYTKNRNNLKEEVEVEQDGLEVDESKQSTDETEELAVEGKEQDSGEDGDFEKGADQSGEDSEIVEEEETSDQLEARYKKELAEKNDKYIRLVAEFENFKKRTNQEMQTRFKFANQSLALNIITGLDNLERALIQAKDEENEQEKEFIRGIEMVQQQLFDALKQNNIERVFPKGEQFDPNKHEAMGIIETEDVEPDHIAEVFQAGYILHDRVIRPAMVQVAKKKS